MNTRQKIWNLLKEGKSIDEICVLLKDEPCSNIRSYVHRVRRDVKGPINETKTVIDKVYPITEREEDHFNVTLPCCICKRILIITVNKEHLSLYNTEMAKTYRCLMCARPKVRGLKSEIKEENVLKVEESKVDNPVPHVNEEDINHGNCVGE